MAHNSVKIAIILNQCRVTGELLQALNNPDLLTKYNLTWDLFIVDAAKIEMTSLVRK